jgi:hypothetical protein
MIERSEILKFREICLLLSVVHISHGQKAWPVDYSNLDKMLDPDINQTPRDKKRNRLGREASCAVHRRPVSMDFPESGRHRYDEGHRKLAR